MTYANGWVELSSGRRFPMNRGIIGIGPEAESGEIYGGYDDCEIVDGRNYDHGDDPRWSAWTPEERAELADEMIRRWTAFRCAAPNASRA